MPKQKVSKEYIVHEALKLFRKKSYYNTTMADIAEACGLLKGSIYHYFPSKEALMKDIMTYVHAFFREQIFRHAYDAKLDPKQRLLNMIELSEKVYNSPDGGGDLMGNIGLETAHIIPEFSEPIRNFFKDYIKALKTIYAEKHPEEVAQRLAEQGMAELEGALMLSRIFGKKDHLVQVNKRLLERLKDVQTTVW